MQRQPPRKFMPEQQVERQQNLTVYLFNVGQGDHILLQLPNGEYGIIDFHYGSALTAPPALGYLQHLRRKLDKRTPIVISFICLSHPDYDHVKGVKALLDWVKDKRNNVELKKLWMWPSTILEELIKQYEDYGNSFEKSHTTSRATEVGFQLRSIFKLRDSKEMKNNVEYLHDIRKLASNVGGGVKAIGIAPLGKHVKKFDRQAQRDFVRFTIEGNKTPTAQQNLISSILMLIYGGHRLLFGGDTGKDIWQECLTHYNETEQHIEYGPLKGCFVKASHHGSMHSSTEKLWPNILLPGARVGISAGSNNQYGHPHPDTLKHILAAFKKRGDRPEILATNTCRECQSDGNLPEEDIDWVLTERPSLDPLVEKSFEHYRWKPSGRSVRRHSPGAESSQPESSHKGLAAYIFRFGPGDVVRVHRGLSAWIRSDDECMYKNDTSLPFPLCAISKLKQKTGS